MYQSLGGGRDRVRTVCLRNFLLDHQSVGYQHLLMPTERHESQQTALENAFPSTVSNA